MTELAARVASGKDYQKPIKPAKPHKIDAELPLMSCFTAPCRTGCPIQQDIPAYLSRVDEGKLAEALQIVVERNALPHITGNLCPHPCGAKCERSFYEPEGARIRESKLEAARGGFDEVVKKLRAAGPARQAFCRAGRLPRPLAPCPLKPRRRPRLQGVMGKIWPEFDKQELSFP